jgi:hypothetical protein
VILRKVNNSKLARKIAATVFVGKGTTTSPNEQDDLNQTIKRNNQPTNQPTKKSKQNKT